MIYSNTRYAVTREPNPETALYFENAFCLFGTVHGALSDTGDIFSVQNTARPDGFVLSAEAELDEDHSASKQHIVEQASDIVRRNFVIQDPGSELLSGLEQLLFAYGQETYGKRDDLVTEFVATHGAGLDDHFDAQTFVDNLMVAATTAKLRSKGTYAVPVLEDVQSPNWIRGNSLEDGVELALLDLPLVNGEKILWEQVGEIRQDPDSVRQLRNLRLFLEGAEKEKGREYMQDYLLHRVDEYEAAAVKHGFELKKQPIRTLISMRHLPKLAAYGILSLIDPSLSSAHAVMGALAATDIRGAFEEIGDFAISLKEQEVLKGMEGEHQDVEYLVTVKKKLSDGRK